MSDRRWRSRKKSNAGIRGVKSTNIKGKYFNMHDINRQSNNPRGSSPPFPESERWIEDGANGSHWVRMVSPASFHPADPVTGLDQSVIDDASVFLNPKK
jgi:hypothetical protein